MNIISNYNLSIYPKTNKQESKTNPNFGISRLKTSLVTLAGGTAAGIGAAVQESMKVDADTVLGMYGNPASGNKSSGLTDLPTNAVGCTKLHNWCINGNFDDVKKFIAENPYINLSQMDKYGTTYMYLAVSNKQEDLVNLIANMDNYNPTIPNKDGLTDLHCLCENGYTDIVKTLLDKYPEFDINQKTKYGDTCMYLAIYNKQENIINLIAGMDKYNPTIPDINGRTDFHCLCAMGYTDAVKTLLKKHPEFDINQKTKDGNTCMSYAILNNRNGMINFIAGMDDYKPDITDNGGWTHFHRLCAQGYTDIVKTLLDKHPEFNINQQTKYGHTCMSLAIDQKQEDIINLIAGMDKYNPTIPDINGRTDFHRLCQSGYTDALQTLLQKHPEFDINQKTKDGDSCMLLAARNGHKDIMNLIAGMDKYRPDIPDEKGRTDIHRLCVHGCTDLVTTLLEKHPEFDINQKTKKGFTCMSLAIYNKQEDIINLIAGMDKYNPTIPDEDGVTDLHRLCENGYTDAVKTLLQKHPEFDINQKTKKGDTCMSLAIDNGKKEIVNLIAGMDKYNPTITHKDGWTDLFWLSRNGYQNAVKIIQEKHPEFGKNRK